MILGKIRKAFKSRIMGHRNGGRFPSRVIVEKAKWRHNAVCPVVLMIDDLTNAWVKNEKGKTKSPAYDWGGRHHSANSVLTFLNENLYSEFPDIRTVFFTVIGEMYPFSRASRFGYSKPINSDRKSVEFFRSIECSDKFEIAYHGLHHGIPGNKLENYIQEWESFKSVEEGDKTIASAKKIFEDVFGYTLQGGKYGGYKSNAVSEQTIENGGFLWWCRDWTPRATTGNWPSALYECRFFGKGRDVVSIPSTVHGKKWTKRQIEMLLENRQIISVQEHIAPYRPDGSVQTPNVFDDIKELQRLFRFLDRKNVWHATLSDIAAYFTAYSRSIILNEQVDGFNIEYSGKIDNPMLTVKIHCTHLIDIGQPLITITMPDGEAISAQHISKLSDGVYMVDLPVKTGRYIISAAPMPDS